MSRLPIPGSDPNVWGDILNDFLSVSHTPDGSIKPSAVAIQDGSVTTVKLADNAITNSKFDVTTQTTLATVSSKYTKPGSGIPVADLTASLQTSLGLADTALQTAPVSSVNTQTGSVVLTKADLGLTNVDDTADADKPISSATAAALAGKAATSHTHTASQITDFNTEVGNNADVAANTAVRHSHINSTVLGATTASFTTAQETKLSGIAGGATANSSDATLLARANHTGSQAQSTVTNLTTDLAAKAPLASPTFTGTVTVPAPASGTDAATKTYVDSTIAAIPSSAYTRQTAVYTTASLATDATEVGDITLALSYRLLHITTDRPARVRVYGTIAQRTADLGRATGTATTGDHGLVLEFVTAADVLTAALSPTVDGSSLEATPVTAIPISITNLDTTGTVACTFIWIRTE